MKADIGVFHRKNKNWQRNITRHEHDEYNFQKFYDTHRVMNAMRRRVGIGAKKFYKYSRMPPSYPKVDLYHHWRALDFGSTPWIVSTSSGLPFGWPSDRYSKGLELLASEACKRIIVTGSCARDWQCSKAKQEPRFARPIMEKVEVLPPAQDLLIPKWEAKPAGQPGPLRLVFVGAGFLRKGGLELLRVVERLRSEGDEIALDVVSSLGSWQGENVTGHTGQARREARRLMREIAKVTWHGRLPNDEVLDIFKQGHIGLLPSYTETYGYTVLEAQASGCPTITTDINAFPDINPDKVGWRIPIDGEDYDFQSEEGRALISDRLEKGLYRRLKRILEDRSVIREKGKAALARIAEEHSPAQHRRRLRAIYDESTS
jgi:glycosyltransferase involved in cell wall biosynthesis